MPKLPLTLRVFCDDELVDRKEDPDFLEVLRVGSSYVHELNGRERKLLILDLQTRPGNLLRGTEVSCYTTLSAA